MKNTILANRYAKALFAVAKEEAEGSLAAYAEALNELSELFQQVPEIRDGLSNPIYPMDVKEKVMEYIVGQMESSQVLKNFLKLLVAKKRAGILPDIVEAFQALVDRENNVCQGTVVSAAALGSELMAKVQSTLEKITGKQVVLHATVDPSILGGIIAKVGDLVLDGSIRTQLVGLKESIKGSE